MRLSGRIVVVAVPDAADEIAGEADEPGVAIGVGGAGLAGGLDAGKDGAPGRALFDHLVHHEGHVGRDLGREHLLRLGAVAIEPPDGLAGAGAHFENGMRRDRLAGVGESGVGDRVVEHGHLVGADRQRRRVGQGRAQSHCLGIGDDLGPAVLGLVPLAAARADHHRQLDRDGVDRPRQRHGQASSNPNSRRNSFSGTSCRDRSGRRSPSS